MEEVVRSGSDVGTSEWGIVLTAAEEAALDLPGRMQFANQLSEELLPYADSLPTYGGSYIEPSRGGGIVIQLTNDDPTVVARVHKLAPTRTVECGSKSFNIPGPSS